MIIKTFEELEILCKELKSCKEIFVDTEFVSEGRYAADLGSIQIGYNTDKAVFVDPLAIDDLSPLFDIFKDEGILKVFHAAKQDLYILNKILLKEECLVTPIFDTQIAASLVLSEDQMSFAKLVAIVTGKRLEKAHGFTNWLKRPLDPEQLEYALDDVLYLMPVYYFLRDKLLELNRMEWAKTEFLLLEDGENYVAKNPQTVYKKIKGADRLKGRALSLLCALAAYRENTASATNTPPSKIVRDEVLLELARRPVTTMKGLFNVRGMAEQQIRVYGNELVNVMSQLEHPVAEPVKKYEPTPAANEPLVDFLQLCLRLISQEENIGLSTLGTRSDLCDVVTFGKDSNSKLLKGWRYDVAGAKLMEALEGKLAAKIHEKEARVVLKREE